MVRLAVFALTAGGLALFALPASANDDIRYRVIKGDTLLALAEKYFIRAQDYRIVQKSNRIKNPRAIPIGTELLIPRSILKYQPAKARLVSVRGRVTTVEGQATQSAANGLVLGEGAILKTAGSSFATLALDDGSRVSLPSNSDLRILRLRKYLLGAALDYDFELGRGGARSKVAPLKSRDDRYQVRTPKAVSAVRGTDFQTRFDEASARDFAEVVEGGLAVGVAGSAPQALPAGNGLAVNSDGSSISEALLAAPLLEGAGKMQSNKSVMIALPQRSEASAMRLSIASDAGFIDQVADIIASGSNAEFAELDDGNYFLRARAISANGLEGLPSTYAFKRRMNAVSASAGGGNDGWNFKWLGEGRGVMRYHFQLFFGSINSTPMVDEAGLTAQQISLSDLPAGDYYWRVGSVQYVDDEASTNWTKFEKISVSVE